MASSFDKRIGLLTMLSIIVTVSLVDPTQPVSEASTAPEIETIPKSIERIRNANDLIHESIHSPLLEAMTEETIIHLSCRHENDDVYNWRCVVRTTLVDTERRGIDDDNGNDDKGNGIVLVILLLSTVVACTYSFSYVQRALHKKVYLIRLWWYAREKNKFDFYNDAKTKKEKQKKIGTTTMGTTRNITTKPRSTNDRKRVMLRQSKTTDTTTSR